MLLLKYIAEDAAFLAPVMLFCAAELGFKHIRYHRQGYNLRMGMNNISSESKSVVFKRHDIAEAGIVREIPHPFPEGVKKVVDRHSVISLKTHGMNGSINYNLMGTDTRHSVIYSAAAPFKLTLYAEGRIFVGNHAGKPVAVILFAKGAQGINLVRSMNFVSVAEGAVYLRFFTVRIMPLHKEIMGSAASFSGDYTPFLFNRVKPQF